MKNCEKTAASGAGKAGLSREQAKAYPRGSLFSLDVQFRHGAERPPPHQVEYFFRSTASAASAGFT